MPPLTLNPIGTVRSPRKEPIDDDWGAIVATLELDPNVLSPEAVLRLTDFSHLEVVFFLDRVADDELEAGARHPRNRTDLPKVGILAQRAKRRPNRIAVSRCRLLSASGLTLTVEALDAIDGTPILDIKPWFREFAPRGEIRQPDWVSDLMKEYY